MDKYNLEESITCPKCGSIFLRACTMNIRHVPEHDDTAAFMRLSCSCGFSWQRRPLDYEGESKTTEFTEMEHP